MRENYKFTDEEWEDFLAGVEIWRDIPGWEFGYQVSTFGNVRTKDRIVKQRENTVMPIWSRILKFGIHYRDYRTVYLCNISKQKYFVHRLVAITFIYNPENKREVNHLNGKKYENHLSNLEWCTPSENAKHAFKNGLKQRPKGLKGIFGKDNKNSIPIVQYDKLGNVLNRYYSAKEAADDNGLNYTHIVDCANGNRKTHGGYIWKHS
jgi:hypothetical protein